MKQLVELQKQSRVFKSLDAELVFVFREEREGVDGLKKIMDKHKPDFTLALDLDKKSSKAYSPARMTFDNFVIDSDGKVRNIIKGTLQTRAKAEEFIKTLTQIQSEKKNENRPAAFLSLDSVGTSGLLIWSSHCLMQ